MVLSDLIEPSRRNFGLFERLKHIPTQYHFINEYPCMQLKCCLLDVYFIFLDFCPKKKKKFE